MPWVFWGSICPHPDMMRCDIAHDSLKRLEKARFFFELARVRIAATPQLIGFPRSLTRRCGSKFDKVLG